MSSTSGIGARTEIAAEFTARTQLTDTEAAQSRTPQPVTHSIPGLEGLHSMRRAEVTFGTGSYHSHDGGSESAPKSASASLAGRRSISAFSQGTSNRAEDDRAIRRVKAAKYHADTCCAALRENRCGYKESAVNQYADAVLGLYSEHIDNESFAKAVDASRQICHKKIMEVNSVNWRGISYFNGRVTDALKAFSDAVSSAADKLDRPDAFRKRPIAPLQPRTSLLTEQIKAQADAGLTFPGVNSR